MRTRTERLQATTFFEKLSRYNRYRQKLSHTELNEILALFPQITAVDSRTTVATKVEYLSAANFLVYHGKKPERLEALSNAELQTLNTRFKHPPTADRAEILSRITEFGESQEDHNDPPSEDSSGTDQDRLRPREEQFDSQKSTNTTKTRKSKARTSTRHALGEEDEEEESFSDDSAECGSERSRRREPRRKRKCKHTSFKRKNKRSDLFGADEYEDEDDSTFSGESSFSDGNDARRRKKRAARSRRRGEGHDSNSSDPSVPPPTKRGGPRRTSKAARITTPSSSTATESTSPGTSEGRTPHNEFASSRRLSNESSRARSIRSSDRPTPRRGSRRIVAGDGNSSSSATSAGEETDARPRRTSPRSSARGERPQEQNVARPRGRLQRRNPGASPRDATTRRRRRKARSSSGSDVASSSEEDRDSSPEPTRFLKLNKDYAATAIAACG